MIKRRPLFVPLFFLLAFLIMIPFTASSVAIQPRLVILDLPYLDLQKLSTDYPNLKQLASTGSTGLVRIPLTSAANNSNPFIQRTIEQIASKRAIKTVFIGNKEQNSLHQSCTAMVINGDNRFRLTGDLKTGANMIVKYYRIYREQAGVILITLGKSRFNSDKEKYFQQKIADYYDYLISRISAETDFNNTLLMICSSQPPDQLTVMNSALTPIILKGLNFTTGILYSPSTRKGGILTFNDLRSLIFRFQDPKNKTMLSIASIPGKWRTVADNQHALMKNYAIRWPVLTIYGYLLIGVVLLLIGGFVFHLHRGFIEFSAWSFLYLLTIPAAFLLEALFDPLNWKSITIFTCFISGILFLFSYFFSGRSLSKTLLFIAFLTTGTMVIDGLLNGYYEHKSFLGYSVVAGARYYGIGNEYMGILLGSYIAGVALSLQNLKQWRREILWSATILISLILIHPHFGADVGGGITALMGLGITNFLWLKQPIRFKESVGLSLLTLFIFILMGALDLYVYKSSMSHLGKLLLSVQNNGMGVFMDLVIRKMALNLRLISSMPLAIILIGALLAIPLLYRFPPRSIKELTEKYPATMSGFVGLAITALIGLVSNDSGIVSAAMTFLFGLGLIIVLAMKEYFRISTTN